ncbi:MAG: hypothetical protein OEM39_01565 [Acidimicrobiia bacterium]|nr:hypothetical protein [Acidimicrobiia bacterium]MDH3462521.1 hypothetical protein [Acidimicrobiia bacterium]
MSEVLDELVITEATHPHISMPLYVMWLFLGLAGRDGLTRVWVVGLGVVLELGPESDLSEVPVYQGLSRPRWIQSRPWVSSRTH